MVRGIQDRGRVKSICLIDEAGEFCTARTDPSIPKLREDVRGELLQGRSVQIIRQGIKSITVSFLDEWLGPLIQEFGLEQVRQNVHFDPPLEPFLAKQLDRSRRLRAGRPSL